MLLVIIGHGAYLNIQTKFGGTHYDINHDNVKCVAQFIYGSIVTFIYTFHMPLFMAVSGAVFSLGYNRISSTSKLARRKAKRLLLPFMITATLVAIPIKYLTGYFDLSDNVVKDIFMGQYLLFGNSHLWFVVSLFICFVVFRTIEPLFRKWPVAMWGLVLLLSWCGFILEAKMGDGLGIPGFAKHLLYFAIGFYAFDWCRSYQPKWYIFIIILTAQIVLYLLKAPFPQWYVRLPLITIMALLGCFNILTLCKLIEAKYKEVILSSRCYQFASKYSYELYLYSDPFNYLLLAIFFSIEGFDPYGNSAHSSILFFSRIAATICLAICVIYLFKIPKYIKSRSLSSPPQN